MIDDNQAQNKSLIEYDENYASCYAITGIAADLWNSGDNNTYWDFQNTSCDYCIPLAINTSWSAWADTEACQSNSYLTEERSLTEYDNNTCYAITGLVADNFTNTTYNEYQEEECIYDAGGGGDGGDDGDGDEEAPEYIDNPGGIVCYMSLNENSGTTAHDISGNSNDGTITGATWYNDGILNTLTAVTDYTIDPTTGLFTIVNVEYSWAWMNVSWDYVTGEDCATINVDEVGSSFGLFIMSLLGFLGVMGVMVAIVWLMKYLGPLFSKESGMQSLAGS